LLRQPGIEFFASSSTPTPAGTFKQRPLPRTRSVTSDNDVVQIRLALGKERDPPFRSTVLLTVGVTACLPPRATLHSRRQKWDAFCILAATLKV
jgi:hypothetical protein